MFTAIILFYMCFVLIMAYETFLAYTSLTEDSLKKQDFLKFLAAPVGTVLFILSIWNQINDFSWTGLIAILLLLVSIIISSTFVPKSFQRKAPKVWIRNFILILSIVALVI